MNGSDKPLRRKQYRETSDTFNMISGTRTTFEVCTKNEVTHPITVDNQFYAALIRMLLTEAGYRCQR